MLTKIFHCDRDREQASVVAPRVDDQMPEGWVRVVIGYQRADLVRDVFVYVFCPRCAGFMDDVLQTLGLPSSPRAT